MEYKAPRITAVTSLLTALIFLAGPPTVSAAGTEEQDRAMQEELQQLKDQGKAMQEELRRLKEQGKAMEEELARVRGEQKELKGEQIELTKEATAAAAALPNFRYRPGAGLLIEDTKGAWGIRFFLQHQYISSFFLDENRPKNGAVQGAIEPRRLRPRFNYFWDNGFHEFDFWVDINNAGTTRGGPWNAFKANYAAHFEQISPFLPTLWVGANPSFWMNGADINRSSFTGGRSEFSLLSQGNGIVLGTQTRGAVLDWNAVPLGPAVGRLHLGYSIFGADAFANLANSGNPSGELKNDKKAFSWGVGIQPFARIKNPWIQGLELSFGGKLQGIPNDRFSGYSIAAQQLRAQRIVLIATGPRDDFWEYYTPGLNWQIGPYTLRASGQFDNSHRDKDPSATVKVRGDDGSTIRGRGWRIEHELFLWSPKGGLLTGSPTQAGSIMISPLFDRVDVRAPNAMVGCGGCQGAYAINSGIGLWYFTGMPLNFGLIWDHWRVNKANADVALRIEKGETGKHVDFNTLSFMMRAQW